MSHPCMSARTGLVVDVVEANLTNDTMVVDMHALMSILILIKNIGTLVHELVF